MDQTLLTILGIPVTGFGAACALAMLWCLVGAALWCRQTGTGYGPFIRLTVLALPMAWLCSRLFFVLANCTYYLTTLSNPALALRFWDGGYSVTGALAGLLLAALLAEKWTKLPRGRLLDAVGYGAPLGLMLLCLMERGTGLGLGRSVSGALSFLGISDGMGDLVHPVYLYQAAAAGALCILLTVWMCRRGWEVPSGDLCLTSLTLLGCAQVILESLRNDGHMVVHFVRIQQVAYLLMVLAALLICSRRLAKRGGMKKSRQLVLWLFALLLVGVGVVMEFRVDRGSLKLLYYSVMALCMALLGAMTLICRRRAEGLKKA